MKLKDLNQKDYEPSIIIIIPFEKIGLENICEGVWRQSDYKDLWYRIDAEDPSIPLLRHVHIAHKKHIHSPDSQVSWSADKTRHDRHNFNSGFTGIKRAQALAKALLKIPDDAILESTSIKKTTLLEKLFNVNESENSSCNTVELVYKNA